MPAGTDVVLCGVYDSSTLELLGSSTLDVSEIDSQWFVATFPFAFDWPNGVGLLVGLSMQQGARTNVNMFFRAYSILEYAALDTGMLIFGSGYTPDDAPSIVVHTEYGRVAQCGDPDDTGDKDFYAALDTNIAFVVKLPRYTAGTDGGEPIMPGLSVEPKPVDGSRVNTTLDTLQWTSGNYSSNFDVYFGEVGNMALVAKGQTETSYTGITVDPLQEYQWRIDSINNNGITTGTVWTFIGKELLLPPVPSASVKRVVAAALNKIWYEDV